MPVKKTNERDMLKAVPVSNHAMECTRRAEGKLLVEIPIRRPAWMIPPLSWMLPFSSVRRIELDSIGASVLDLCDGRRNVESIIEIFASTNKLSFREAQLAVGQFLKMLMERGIVVMLGKTTKDSA